MAWPSNLTPKPPFKVSCSQTKGSYFAAGPKVPLAKEIVHTGKPKRRLAYEDGKLRSEDDMATWVGENVGFKSMDDITVSDGNISANLRRRDIPDAFTTEGDIGPAARAERAIRSLVDFKPVFNHFQPFLHRPDLLKDYHGADANAQLGGVKHILVERVKVEHGRRARRAFWINPERNYAVSRYEEDVDGKLTFQVDIGYVQHDRGFVVPSNWRIQEHTLDGLLERDITATVTSCRINDDIDDGEFTITFPAKTLVTDLRSPQLPGVFLVRNDGTHRTLSKAELKAYSRDDILKLAGEGSAAWTSRILLYFACILTAAGIAWGVWRYRRLHSQ